MQIDVANKTIAIRWRSEGDRRSVCGVTDHRDKIIIEINDGAQARRVDEIYKYFRSSAAVASAVR